MLFRTQIIFCSSELRLHFRIAEVGSLLSLNRAWRAQVTLVIKYLQSDCSQALHKNMANKTIFNQIEMLQFKMQQE